ncbi:MAG: hypothetical protein ABR520_07475 [Mycobacteriales bacterium]|nr:hypothetical protein [Frankia sp.]
MDDTRARARPRWQALWFVCLVGVVGPALGLYFLGLIAAFVLAIDATRPKGIRAAGVAVLAWWTWVWTLPGVPPYPSFALLGIAATSLVRSAAATWRAERHAAIAAAGLAVGVATLAVLSLLPYGVRAPRVDRSHALAQALDAHRSAGSGAIDARWAQVATARQRFIQRPLYYVVLFEPNPSLASTDDGEPCFRRSETYRIDGVDARATDLGKVEARAADGGCLRLKVGTRAELTRIDV